MLLIDRLKKALAGEGGAAVVAAIERETEERAAASRRRRELGEQIAAAVRRRTEELPPLEAARVKAVAEFDDARRRLHDAEQAASDAASAKFAVEFHVDETIRAAKAELRGTAEKWLHDAVEHARERLREWNNYQGAKLHFWSAEKVAVAPDPSDPEYKAMRRHGISYRMNRVCSNAAALAELRDRMSNGIDQLVRFTEQVEPAIKADVDAILEAFAERTWKDHAARLVWREPNAPRYDAEGRRLAA
jgi:hypothetical protein